MYYKEIEPGVFLYLKMKGNNQLVDWLTPDISIQIIHHSIMIVSTSSLWLSQDYLRSSKSVSIFVFSHWQIWNISKN